jgi:hypothetical protein
MWQSEYVCVCVIACLKCFFLEGFWRANVCRPNKYSQEKGVFYTVCIDNFRHKICINYNYMCIVDILNTYMYIYIFRLVSHILLSCPCLFFVCTRMHMCLCIYISLYDSWPPTVSMHMLSTYTLSLFLSLSIVGTEFWKRLCVEHGISR